MKLDLLDGRLGMTLAAFHLKKKNVLTADLSNPGYQQTAGEARSQGFDLQFSGQLTEQLRLIGAYAYIDAEVTKDENIARGSRLLNVPKHSGSLMGVYEFREGWLHGADAGAAVNYVGERAGDSSDSGFELPAYTTVDLLAHYPLASNATLGVNVNNLFDRRYYERSYNNVWSPRRAAQPDHEPDPELLSPLPPPGSHAMQGRTPLLETLRELECEIRLLTVYARECCGCYEILRRKLDRLSGLIGEDCSRAQWQADSDDPALQALGLRLRDAAVQALCELEKHLCQGVLHEPGEMGRYLGSLLESIRGELDSAGIDADARVLFVGSGALPTSALVAGAGGRRTFVLPGHRRGGPGLCPRDRPLPGAGGAHAVFLAAAGGTGVFPRCHAFPDRFAGAAEKRGAGADPPGHARRRQGPAASRQRHQGTVQLPGGTGRTGGLAGLRGAGQPAAVRHPDPGEGRSMNAADESLGNVLLVGLGAVAIQVALDLRRHGAGRLGALNHPGRRSQRIAEALARGACLQLEGQGQHRWLSGNAALDVFHQDPAELRDDWQTLVLCVPADSYLDVVRGLPWERLGGVRTLLLVSAFIGANLLVRSALPAGCQATVLSLSSYYAATKVIDETQPLRALTKAVKRRVYLVPAGRTARRGRPGGESWPEAGWRWYPGDAGSGGGPQRHHLRAQSVLSRRVRPRPDTFRAGAARFHVQALPGGTYHPGAIEPCGGCGAS